MEKFEFFKFSSLMIFKILFFAFFPNVVRACILKPFAKHTSKILPQPSYQHYKNVTGAGNVDAEKRMRKQVTWALGNTLVEGSKVVEENHFLFDILKSCGDTLVSQ